MNQTRYTLIGLGRPRSAWFADVASWATSGAIAADFSKCVSVAEVQSQLSSLTPYSALLVESGVSGLDLDLIDLARRNDTAVIVVGDSGLGRNHWLGLGAATVASLPLSPQSLSDILTEHAIEVSGNVAVDISAAGDPTASTGRTITVCGPGGTGASTVACAVAQALAADPLNAGLVVVADFARNAEQAMLHDSPDLIPGVEELVDLHRSRRPSNEEVRALTFDVPSRGYRLLLGQRRCGAWSAMPPKAVESSMTALARTFRVAVTDVTADFETETDGGSVDVAERNALALHAVHRSDVVIVVGAQGVKGIHALARTITDLVSTGVEAGRILPVVNRSTLRILERATTTKTLAALVGHDSLASPAFLPEANVESATLSADMLPSKLVQPIGKAVVAMLERVPESGDVVSAKEATPIVPGSLGLATAGGGDAR